MSKGRDNRLAGQIGEYLVCAELGKRGLIATPFSGNVPAFDVLAADDLCRTVPIQVKASRSDNWPSDARDWMQISLDPETKAQKNLGPVQIKNPDLIYVYVAIAPPDGGRDRFRTTGTKAQTYALTGPGWKGTLPAGVQELKSPTTMVWILGRIYCTGTPEDYKAVHAAQDAF